MSNCRNSLSSISYSTPPTTFRVHKTLSFTFVPRSLRRWVCVLIELADDTKVHIQGAIIVDGKKTTTGGQVYVGRHLSESRVRWVKDINLRTGLDAISQTRYAWIIREVTDDNVETYQQKFGMCLNTGNTLPSHSIGSN